MYVTAQIQAHAHALDEPGNTAAEQAGHSKTRREREADAQAPREESIRNARIEYVGKYQSCMVSKWP